MIASLVSSQRVSSFIRTRQLVPMRSGVRQPLIGLLAGGCFRHAVAAGQQSFSRAAERSERAGEGRGYCAFHIHALHQAWQNRGRHGAGTGRLAP